MAQDEDESPEIAAELRRVNRRARDLEADLRTTQRLPEQVRAMLLNVEHVTRDLSEALGTNRDRARAVFRELFAVGLVFEPNEAGKRTVLAVRGAARPSSSEVNGDPIGT